MTLCRASAGISSYFEAAGRKGQVSMRARILLAVGIIMLIKSDAWGAAPIITGWSSTGGNPVNKDDAQDIMYLVEPDKSLIFTVTVDQAVDYEWQVNKSPESSAVSNVFAWSVPGENGIWEIHCRVWNAQNEEAHKECIVGDVVR